jgi:hypothetical protein
VPPTEGDAVLQFESPRFADDPLLLDILNDPDTGKKKLGPGSPPGSVRTLQEAVFDLTWNLQTSEPVIRTRAEFVVGVYGPKTTQAVRAFKTRYGIRFPPDDPDGVVDGLAGPRTLARLDRTCVLLDQAIAAIAQKARDLIDRGVDVTFDPMERLATPCEGTSGAWTPAQVAGTFGGIFFRRGHGEANEVHGNIFDTYLQSFVRGPLGFPITDEEEINDLPGFVASHFQHGRLRCELATGVVDELVSEIAEPEPDPAF